MAEQKKRTAALHVIRNGREEVIEAEIEDEELPEGRKRQLALIDEAARGSIDAAAELAEGYLSGSFDGTVALQKGLKWARYAAKRGNGKAEALLAEYAQEEN